MKKEIWEKSENSSKMRQCKIMQTSDLDRKMQIHIPATLTRSLGWKVHRPVRPPKIYGNIRKKCVITILVKSGLVKETTFISFGRQICLMVYFLRVVVNIGILSERYWRWQNVQAASENKRFIRKFAGRLLWLFFRWWQKKSGVYSWDDNKFIDFLASCVGTRSIVGMQ